MKNPLSLEAFADWAEKRLPEAEYSYFHIPSCACSQYADYLGLSEVWWAANDFIDHSRGDFWSTADGFAFALPHTFGALAARLRAAS